MTHDDVDEAPEKANDPEEFADWLFDTVSETLRERPEAGAWADPPSCATTQELRAFLVQAREDFHALRRSLVKSDAAFDRLHEWVSGGKPLPGPWRRHDVPASGAVGETEDAE
ncbi:hypothetical protein [Nocardiopsis algeriensis]|uniref:Uncharacterized protein n=1 Tax=Nocardiopsis algeriensis TaxID=1478215 RepID=A0A841IK05_9ACTN|nr:hypothetical protein [Nocardiopsis algeriensis]